jgi:aminopeptidase N
MEHQTMNAYGNHFHYTKVGGEDYDGLMHHEFGHEWWGNKVTARDWADYWIHEGICTYGDGLYILAMEGEDAYNKYFQRTGRSIRNEAPIILGKDIDEEAAYQGDIYPKGAFFMHTLRWVMGDSLFFPALKGFVTDPDYTYDHLVTTDDVQAYFSRRAGVDLTPLFNLYLRTTDKLEVHVRKVSPGHYAVRLTHMPMTLPLEVTTSAGNRVLRVGADEVAFDSETQPVVDPRMFYLTKVTVE